MEGDRDQSHKNYMPYTNNLLKRCERGLPFFGITIGVFGVVVQYSIIYLKDCIENDKIAAAVVVSFFSYLLGAMVYWSYLKTIFTDAGSVNKNWKHPLAEEAKEEQEDQQRDHSVNRRKQFDVNMQDKYNRITEVFKFNSRNYSNSGVESEEV